MITNITTNTGNRQQYLVSFHYGNTKKEIKFGNENCCGLEKINALIL